MVSRKKREKNKGKVHPADLAKRQNQRLERRIDPAVLSATSSLEIRPVVGLSERIEDAAVFNREQRSKLHEGLQNEAANVHESLELTYQGKFEESISKLKEIARSSPFSDWRLFVRGLHAFYASDLETARQNWTKLDPTRRPARIASTLLLAETEQPLSDTLASPPTELVSHARTLRLRKNVVTAAEAIAKVKHRDPDVAFSVSQFAMFSSFSSSFRKLDPGFVSRVGQACLGLAVKQGDLDIFDRLKRLVPGPSDDPNWNRTKAIYLVDFENSAETMLKSTQAYVVQDLPKLSQMPDPLKKALSCKLFLLAAEVKGNGSEDPFGFGLFFRQADTDYKGVNALLRQAIQCYPTYRLPHEKLIASLKKEFEENDRHNGSKLDETRLEKEILAAKEALVKAIPDEIETSLELIDLYLDEDELDKANALVKNLSGQRLEDPLAKALPWKLKVKEAMRLSRRKADLGLAWIALDEAESLWPLWLNKNWLPFLQAGLALRGGDQAKFETLTGEAKKSQKTSPFLGDLMTFAALQQMNIPGPELKVYRNRVESPLEKVNEMELTVLFSIGSFFWDLARTGLKHKGYRMQASKVGKAFVERLKSFIKDDLSPVQIDAFSWGAHHKFWPVANDYLPRPAILRRAMKEPRLAAAILDWLLQLPQFPIYQIQTYAPLISIAKEAARTEKDAFYRYQFDKVSDSVNAILQESQALEERRKSFGSSKANNDEWEDDELDDLEDDDEYGFFEDDEDDDSEEELCGCTRCRAKRAREAMQFDQILREQPKAIADCFAKLGPEGTAKIAELLQQSKSPEELAEAIGKLFPDDGVSPKEMIDFVMAMNVAESEPDDDFPIDAELDSNPAPKSAAELKASRKRREKELERKKREASRSRR